jgi:hypothetical protein
MSGRIRVKISNTLSQQVLHRILFVLKINKNDVDGQVARMGRGSFPKSVLTGKLGRKRLLEKNRLR